MQGIVVDASMAAAWTLEDEKSQRGNEILREIKNFSRLTISLFWYEYRNILIGNYKRGRIIKEKIPLLLQDINALGLQECRINNDAQIFSFAFQYELSFYDAAYLTLAIQENAILATNDKKLLRAARAQGVAVRTTLDE